MDRQIDYSDDPIAAYLGRLAALLPPDRADRMRLLEEARDHLISACAAERGAGVSDALAQRRAIARFGSAELVAACFIGEGLDPIGRPNPADGDASAPPRPSAETERGTRSWRTDQTVTLAVTYHDGADRMHDQIRRALPILSRLFAAIVVQASNAAPERSLALLSDAGARIGRDDPTVPRGPAHLGRVRLALLSRALEVPHSFIFLIDFDSLLHWADRYPDELAWVVADLPARDLTIVGRTARAWDSYPRSQRATEAPVNALFAQLTGRDWDVVGCRRGLSRRAARAIVDGCAEASVASDVAWPLFLLRAGTFSAACPRVEGAEFETGDRHGPEIAAAGSHARWVDALDRDPRRWAWRLDVARMHVAALIPRDGPDARPEGRIR